MTAFINRVFQVLAGAVFLSILMRLADELAGRPGIAYLLVFYTLAAIAFCAKD